MHKYLSLFRGIIFTQYYIIFSFFIIHPFFYTELIRNLKERKNIMGKSTLKSEILQITERETTKSLYNDQFEKLGVSAIAISKELQIDRTNASRNLNKLFKF